MKQHISPKQLDELSEKGKRKLNKWYKKYEWETIPGSTDGDGYSEGVYLEPLLSIGQMIEFLDEHRIVDLHIYADFPAANKDVTFKVENKGIKKPNDGIGIHTKVGFLCDALWEAVKQVLNEI